MRVVSMFRESRYKNERVALIFRENRAQELQTYDMHMYVHAFLGYDFVQRKTGCKDDTNELSRAPILNTYFQGITVVKLLCGFFILWEGRMGCALVMPGNRLTSACGNMNYHARTGFHRLHCRQEVCPRTSHKAAFVSITWD